jgi:selenocysteine-specific elongation factor
VAADDGVMPQTIEHVDIVHLLGVRAGLIVLTKIDMVDETIADLAVEEIRKLVRGTIFADAEICRVSSVTGEGIPELKDKLEALARQIPPRSAAGEFRMPIQRVFSLPGIGTVITGIPVAGSVRPGEELEILPLGELVKVRGIHAYGGKVDEAVAGHSTALSVPDAKESGVHRGMVAGRPGVYASGDAVDIEVEIIGRAAPLRHRAGIRFHTGTVEVRGELLLLDREVLLAGERASVRVELDEPVACAAGDRCLVRLQNPAVTVGGGRVLRLGQAQGRYRRKALGEELQGLLAAGDLPEARIEHELKLAGAEGRGIDDLAHALGCEESRVVELVTAMPGVLLHRQAMRAFPMAAAVAGERELFESVERILQKRAAAASIKRTALRTTKTLPQPLIEALLDQLAEKGRVRTGSQGMVLFLERLKPLPAALQQQLDAVVKVCQARGYKPPELAELEQASGLRGDQLQGLLDRAQDEGRIEKVGDHYYAMAVVRKAMHAIRANCLRHAEVLEIPELRDELDTSRKFLIPLLEHVDGLGLTVLRGGFRRLLPGSDISKELAREAAAS